MPKFCPKCGKGLKPGKSSCTACGAKMKTRQAKTKTRQVRKTAPVPAPPPVKPVRAPAAPLPPPPPSKGGAGCGTGCLVGCLIVVLVVLLILGILIGVGYYFLFGMKKGEAGDYFDIDPKSKKEKTVKCGDSLACLENNLKKCAPAKGEADLGEFAEAEFEVLGFAEGSDSCVVFAKIIELNELPEGLDIIPGFLLDKVFEDLSFECLIPEKVYQKGIEDVGEYIGDNLVEACKGPLFDLAERFGVDLEDLED